MRERFTTTRQRYAAAFAASGVGLLLGALWGQFQVGLSPMFQTWVLMSSIQVVIGLVLMWIWRFDGRGVDGDRAS